MIKCYEFSVRQLYLSSSLRPQSQFGGDLLKGKRKSVRLVTTKQAMHTTLRSELARGSYSFLHPKNATYIRECLKLCAERFGIRIYEFSINSNHLHLLTLARTRSGYKAFLRVLSGMIAMKITGSKKGKALLKSFWATRPWSRIVTWGRAFFTAKAYVIQNQLESSGRIRYKPRKQSREGKASP